MRDVVSELILIGLLTLFLTIPYGRFVHGFYRLLALVKYALERRRPVILIGSEG